ncbi:MAG: redoxin family protein [Hyphomicrobiales bacterium]|nr:redoxin family protein [Hyphomicrobiales bacterium]
MPTRRMILGGAALTVPILGGVFLAAETGRLDLLTPHLPEAADLPPVPGVTWQGSPVPGLARAGFFEGVSVLNVWASWCPYCRSEHAELMRLSARPGLRLFGLLTDDSEAAAARYLAEAGNPYARLGLDSRRLWQRALKHRGIPQTYIFRADGVFAGKIAGELTPSRVSERLDPLLARASAGTS